MNVSPKVSVLTATYNRPYGLLGAIRSVQAQTFKDYEHIVVGDHCPAADRVTEAVDDKRIVYRNLEKNNNDLGVTPLNIAFGMARAEWIAVLADDNLWKPDHLERLYQGVLEHPNVAFCYGSCEVRHKTGRSQGYPIFRDSKWPAWKAIDLGESLYNKKIVEHYGLWSQDKGSYSYDWGLYEAMIRGGEKWHHVPRCFTFCFYVEDEAVKLGNIDKTKDGLAVGEDDVRFASQTQHY